MDENREDSWSAACILRRVPNPRAQVGMEYEEFVSQIQLAIIGWRMGETGRLHKWRHGMDGKGVKDLGQGNGYALAGRV